MSVFDPRGRPRSSTIRQFQRALGILDNAVNTGYTITSSKSKSDFKEPKSKKQKTKQVSVGSKYGSRIGRRQTKSKNTVTAPGPKNLKQRVSALEKDLKQDMSYKYYKFIDARSIQCDLGRCRFDDIVSINSGRITGCIDALPIGTGTDVNVTTVAENTQVQVKDVWGECIATNTLDQPCTVNIYACMAKNDNDLPPDSYLRQAATNFGYPAPDGTDVANSTVVLYPTDIPDFNKNWKIVGNVKGILEPGDNLRLTASIPDFIWSQDFYVQQGTPANMKHKSMVFMVRVMGETCHDSANGTRTSTLPARVNCRSKGYFTIEYAGNVSSRSVEVEDSYDTGTFTGIPTTIGAGISTYTG